MNIFNSIDLFRGDGRAVVSTGTFDGVHLGHRAIIGRMKSIAEEVGGSTVIITFEPHPRIALGADADKLKLLNTSEEKIALLRDSGIDHLIILAFTREFAATPYHEFVRSFLAEKLRASAVVVGYNHHFGNRREGNYGLLLELAPQLGMRVEEVPEVDVEGRHVSSTVIREKLGRGQVQEAAELLGYCYSLKGEVVHGDKRGRMVGFPTANLGKLPPYKMIPATGVYAVMADIDGKHYHGMCNIGHKPTFNSDGSLQTVEVNLFGLDESVYGRSMSLSFAARLRDEIKFSGPEELAAQLRIDREQTESILKSCTCRKISG